MEKCSAGWKYLMCVFVCLHAKGDFKRRLPRTPSTGTMSSADDLDEREPPSPSDNGWLYKLNSVIVAVCVHRCVVTHHRFMFIMHVLNCSHPCFCCLCSCADGLGVDIGKMPQLTVPLSPPKVLHFSNNC